MHLYLFFLANLGAQVDGQGLSRMMRINVLLVLKIWEVKRENVSKLCPRTSDHTLYS